jgi:hypothetical protein
MVQIYSKLKRRNGGIGLPEYRVPLMIPGAILVPIGFFWYGWSIQAKAHWIMPNIGATLLGSGIIISMQCITSYIIDAYSMYAASAVAATTVLRAIAGFSTSSPLAIREKNILSSTYMPQLSRCLRLICTWPLDMDGQIRFWLLQLLLLGCPHRGCSGNLARGCGRSRSMQRTPAIE